MSSSKWNRLYLGIAPQVQQYSWKKASSPGSYVSQCNRYYQKLNSFAQLLLQWTVSHQLDKSLSSTGLVLSHCHIFWTSFRILPVVLVHPWYFSSAGTIWDEFSFVTTCCIRRCGCLTLIVLFLLNWFISLYFSLEDWLFYPDQISIEVCVSL